MTEMGGQLMLFSAGPRRFAVPVVEVAEVMESPLLHPIPGAPPLLAGAMNFHGRILPVISLAEFWGLPPAPADGKVIVFDDWVASMGILADEVQNIIPVTSVLEEDESREAGVTRQLLLAEGKADLITCQVLLEEMERRLRSRRSFPAQIDSPPTEV